MQYGIRYFVIATMLGLSSLLSACVPSDPSQDAATADEHDDVEEAMGDGAAAEMPPIHLRQTATWRYRDLSRDVEYREELARCYEDQPASQILPLPEDVVSKLGRGYYEVWYQGASMAARGEYWDYESAETCKYKIVHEQAMALNTPDSLSYIDLEKKLGWHVIGPNESAVRRVKALDLPTDDEWRRMGINIPVDPMDDGAAVVAGQACRMSHDEDGAKLCEWVDAGKWGISTVFPPRVFAPFGMPLGVAYASGFVLQYEPAPGDSEKPIVSTEEMTVGVPFDHSVFEEPPNIGFSGQSPIFDMTGGDDHDDE